MFERMKKFYKKFVKIMELKDKADLAQIKAIAGGDRIDKYKKKIGIDFKAIKNIYSRQNKSAESAPTIS